MLRLPPFEHRSQPLASKDKHWRRTFHYAGVALTLIGFSLLLGMLGYHWIAGVDWVDAFYNASMILTGMGPALDFTNLTPGQTQAIKIFAGLYAIYSGVVFLAATGLVLSPGLHRLFHRFSLDLK